jgi:hypothetical protein
VPGAGPEERRRPRWPLWLAALVLLALAAAAVVTVLLADRGGDTPGTGRPRSAGATYQHDPAADGGGRGTDDLRLRFG